MSLLRDYAASLSQPTLPLTRGASVPRYDEVIDADGRMRPAWRDLAAVVSDLTADDLRRISRDGADLLADDGADYGRAGGPPRPWQLDPLPLVIDGAEWERLEKGLAQRAELLSAVLADLYGAQRLLAERIVPSAAVFAHRRFLRPLVGTMDAAPLVIAGTDLGRDTAGRWQVLGDRVQAPSGLGFAMENRRVMTRLLPGLHRETRAHRTEPFVTAMRMALVQAAPETVDNPRAVVLSPGTRSETAFDQAFLANVLGFPLVQGGDLVVRDDHVWMKPIGWPRARPVDRVDVIMRRVDADWTDPLELRGESQLGVAGLVEVVRRGNVRIVNGLGAGVLENPALLAYMPAICRFLLDEELLLGVAPTWWCGDDAQRAEALRLLDEDADGIVLQPIDGSLHQHSGLSPARWRELIDRAPHRYAAQLRLPLSQAPLLAPSRRSSDVERHPVTLRTFTVLDGSTHRAFVGGLATAAVPGASIPTTKDVWVLKANVDDPDQGIDRVIGAAFARALPVFSPRALDDLFWAGRYAERAEDMVRLVGTVEQFSRGMRRLPAPDADPLGLALARLAGVRFDDRGDELRSLLVDDDRAGGVADSLARLRETLVGVRDQLSDDTWRVFSATDRMTARLRTRAPYPLADAASRMLTGLLSLYGVTDSMMRDDGWHAFEVGRRLERALQVCILVQSSLPAIDGAEADEAMARVLTAAESIVTYRRRLGGSGRPAEALELLLADDANPRSLASAVDAIGEHLSALPRSSGSSRPERLVEQLATRIGDARTIPAGTDLDLFLTETIDDLRQLSDAIGVVHFEQGPLPRSLGAPQPVAVRVGEER